MHPIVKLLTYIAAWGLLLWTLFLYSRVVNGQEADIMPPTTLTIDPLDTSAIGLPQDPQPVTITVSWGNPTVYPNEYTVVGISVDLQTWIQAAVFQAQPTQRVTMVSSNLWLFVRVGNQFGP